MTDCLEGSGVYDRLLKWSGVYDPLFRGGQVYMTDCLDMVRYI